VNADRPSVPPEEDLSLGESSSISESGPPPPSWADLVDVGVAGDRDGGTRDRARRGWLM